MTPNELAHYLCGRLSGALKGALPWATFTPIDCDVEEDGSMGASFTYGFRNETFPPMPDSTIRSLFKIMDRIVSEEVPGRLSYFFHYPTAKRFEALILPEGQDLPKSLQRLTFQQGARKVPWRHASLPNEIGSR